MGEMTKQAVSSVEVKFADLLSKIQRWACLRSCLPPRSPQPPHFFVPGHPACLLRLAFRHAGNNTSALQGVRDTGTDEGDGRSCQEFNQIGVGCAGQTHC